MMDPVPERPSIPPNQKVVREFALPEHKTGFFSELVSRESPRYMSVYPIKRGTLYSTVVGGDQRVSDSFAPLFFLKESRVGSSDSLVLWTWGSDQNAQDTYDSEVSYSGESVAHPVYTRVYTIRRDVYDATPALAYFSALTALIGIKVTAAGTGYSPTDTVNIAGGLGATAELVVDTNGAIQSIIVTNGSAGYDSASLPAITFTTTTGSGATATAIVQPKTAVLVSQKKQELGHDSSFTSQSTDSPYSSTYVRVIRFYMTLPGPLLAGKIISGDAQGALADTSTQELAVSAAAYAPDFRTLSYSDIPIDVNRKTRTVVTLQDAAFPITYDYDIDPETGASIVSSYQVVAASAAGAGSISGGVITTYRHLDKWRSLKTIADSSAMTATTFSEQRFAAYSVPALLDYTGYSWTSQCGAFVIPTSKLRGGDSFMVQMRTDTSFTTTKQTFAGLQLKGQTFMLGKGVQFPNNCLIDAGEVDYSGDCEGTIEFEASSPTYTEYIALIGGTPQLVSGESVRMKNGLYRSTALYVTMP